MWPLMWMKIIRTPIKKKWVSLYIIKKTEPRLIKRKNAVQVAVLIVHTEFCILALVVCRQILLFFMWDKRNIQNTKFNVMYFSVRVHWPVGIAVVCADGSVTLLWSCKLFILGSMCLLRVWPAVLFCLIEACPAWIVEKMACFKNDNSWK